MQVDLPADVAQRVEQLVAAGLASTPAQVIREAIELLDERECELLAIEEGVRAWQSDDLLDFEPFAADWLEQRASERQ